MVIPGWSWLVSKRSAINKFIIQQSVNQWQRFYFISFVICRFYLDSLPILSIFSSCTQLRMFTFLKLLLAYPFLVQWRILRCKRTSNQQHLSDGKKVLWKHTQRDMQTVQIIFDSLSSNGMINTICERWKSKRTKNSSSNMMKQSSNNTNSHNNLGSEIQHFIWIPNLANLFVCKRKLKRISTRMVKRKQCTKSIAYIGCM